MVGKLDKIKIIKYPEYKDSRIAWLGEIPKQWETRRIKFLFSIGRGRVISQQELVDNGAYPVYSSQTQDNGVLGYINSYDFDCTQITWTTDGANAGTVFLRKGKHNCTNVCGTLQPLSNLFSIEFMTYALQIAAQFYKRPDTNGAKIMNGEMAEIFVTLPLKQEQTAIATFLDRKTALIDKAISIKEKQIELLKERRQILIHQAVTRGLNPNVKMKDSGVEWIGEIPEHWEVKRLKNIVDLKMGYAFPSEKFISIGIPVVRIGDLLSNGNVDISTSPRLPEKYSAFIDRFGINYGDILLAMTGGTIGKIAEYLLDEIALLNQRVCSIKIKNSFSRDFVLYWMKSRYWMEYILFKAYGGAQPNISDKDILECRIVLSPDIDEQVEIASYIGRIGQKILTAVMCKEKEIEKLKEYKATLINSVVTGKIKVS